MSRHLARQTTQIAAYDGHTGDHLAAVITVDLRDDGTVLVHTLDGIVPVRVQVDRASIAEQNAAAQEVLDQLDDTLEAGERSRRQPAAVPAVDLGDDPDGDIAGYDGR